MKTVDIIDGHAFLRPLNYLRIRNDYAVWYNWVYPTLLSALLFLSVYYGNWSDKPKVILAPIDEFGSILTVLFPFYFASLAAISSLSGVPSLDKKFKMKNPVSLFIKLSKTEYDTLYLTPRDFLSLLFSYCTTTSLVLLLISFTEDALVMQLTKAGTYAPCLSTATLIIIVFLFSQLLISTLLGVYFLSDYMVRNRERSD